MALKAVEKPSGLSRQMSDLDPGGSDPEEGSNGCKRGNILEPEAGFGVVGGVKRSVWCIVQYASKKMTILRWREED